VIFIDGIDYMMNGIAKKVEKRCLRISCRGKDYFENYETSRKCEGTFEMEWTWSLS